MAFASGHSPCQPYPNVSPYPLTAPLGRAKHIHNAWLIFPDFTFLRETIIMINIGDIVYHVEYDGVIDHTRVGLVLGKKDMPHSRNQYKVQFTGSPIAAWWEENYLCKIEEPINDTRV